jgi:hypothetical protein
MSETAWQTGNNNYLAASLRWLRARLERVIADRLERRLPPTAPRRLFGRTRRVPPEGSAFEIDRRRLTRELDHAATARQAAARLDPPPALIQLQHIFELSDFERDTLLLAASVEFDPAMPALCAEAQGVPAYSYATFALALLTFEEPSWDVVSAHRPLRQSRLLEVNQPTNAALTASPLRAEERIVNYLKGLNLLDERLATLLQAVPAGRADDLAPSQRVAADAAIVRLRNAVAAEKLPPLQLIGNDSGSRVLVAREVAVSLQRTLYRLDAAALPRATSDVELLARLWRRESLLLPVALYLEADEADDAAPIATFLAREPGIIFVGLREAPARGTNAFNVDVERPTSAEQRQAWHSALGGDATADDAARALTSQFNLNLREISEISADTQGEGREAVWEICRRRLRPRLDQLAERLTPKLTWDDLVLPDEQMGLMHGVVGQVRERYRVYDEWGFADRISRGLGISVLFAGESGTGKTLAAEVLASELRLDLYRIDLSAVVSKYIGETEKNLRRMFEAAEQGGAILFFDEADALFGKRSEVKDSHDRYANIEINYLLQRMEGFSGLAILATNMKSALDQAFLRRLRFTVNFPFPGIKERKRIWERSLPPKAPHEALDFDRLARLNLSGGNIHSIALNAAFLAAQRQQVVTMSTLLAAARTELRKLDRAFAEADFR